MEDNIDRKGKILKLQITDYISSKGFSSDAYSYLIDMFITEYCIYYKAVKAIEEEGLTVAGNGDRTFFVKNPNITTKNESLKNIQAISKQMGLSISDSQIFKILNDGNEDDDGFGEFQ